MPEKKRPGGDVLSSINILQGEQLQMVISGLFDGEAYLAKLISLERILSKGIILRREDRPDSNTLRAINLLHSEHLQKVVEGALDGEDYWRGLNLIGRALNEGMDDSGSLEAVDERDGFEDPSQRIFSYPKDFMPLSPSHQLDVLEVQQFCQGLHADPIFISHFDDRREMPPGAEFRAIIPKPSRIIGAGGQLTLESYLKALWIVLDAINEQRKFKNWRRGALGPKHVRILDKTLDFLRFYESRGEGDYMIIPVQFGIKYRGSSTSDVCRQIAGSADEFGLGPYEAAVLLLTHPGRINHHEHLGIDCPGCEYRPSSDDDFTECLSWSWDREHHNLVMGYFSIMLAYAGFGSVTGFKEKLI